MNKEKKIMLAIGMMLIAMIGLVLSLSYQKHQSERNGLSSAQKMIDTCTDRLRQGDLSKEVAALYDGDGIFLAKNLTMPQILRVEKNIHKELEKVERINSGNRKSLNVKAFNQAYEQLMAKVTVSREMLACQIAVNDLFDGEEEINGGDVPVDPVIKESVTLSDVTDMRKRLSQDQSFEEPWQEMLEKLLMQVESQVTVIVSAKEATEKLFAGGNPKASLSETDYKKASELAEKVQNESIKKQLLSQLSQARRLLIARQKNWQSAEVGTDIIPRIVKENPTQEIYGVAYREDSMVWRQLFRQGNQMGVYVSGQNAEGAFCQTTFLLTKRNGEVEILVYRGKSEFSNPDAQYIADGATYQIKSAQEFQPAPSAAPKTVETKKKTGEEMLERVKARIAKGLGKENQALYFTFYLGENLYVVEVAEGSGAGGALLAEYIYLLEDDKIYTYDNQATTVVAEDTGF